LFGSRPLSLSRVSVSALAFVVVGTAELSTAVGIEHRVDDDVVEVVDAKGAVAVDIVIAVLVAKDDTELGIGRA